jgi:glycerol uptake facilitator-like aquaporin
MAGGSSLRSPLLMRKMVAEFVGTALLLVAVIGSGIAAQTLSPTDTTLALTLSDTFAGIAPASVLPFVGAQLVGAALACGVARFLWPELSAAAEAVVVPHERERGVG